MWYGADMADESKKPHSYILSDDEKEIIAEHFNKFIGDRSCHVCGKKSWTPVSRVFTPVVFDRLEGKHRTDRVFPIVMVSCDVCSTLTQFYAKDVGVEFYLPKKDNGEEK